MIEKKEVLHTILVNIKNLINIKKIIKDEISKLEKKNYYEEYGYLNKIVKILNYEIKHVSKNNFKSEIFVNIRFIGEFINVNNNDIIDCQIIDNNNIIIGKSNKIIKVMIIENDKNIKIGENLKVCVLAKQIKFNMKYINVVGVIIN